jgi:nitronate monooxygenase
LWQLKKSNLDRSGRLDYWQAGKSVEGINEIMPVSKMMRAFRTQIAGD